MLYYDNEWKLSKYKIYYTDKDLNKNMENHVGVEGLDWWKNLKFIKINKIEDLTYPEDVLSRYEEIKNKPQTDNQEKLECYINGIDYDKYIKDLENKAKAEQQAKEMEENLPGNLLKVVNDLQYKVLLLEKGVKKI